MKKQLLSCLAIVLLVIATTLAGCGSGNDSDKDESETESAATKEVTQEQTEGEEVELNVLPELEQTMLSAVNEFWGSKKYRT